jgi:hypothetical protein
MNDCQRVGELGILAPRREPHDQTTPFYQMIFGVGGTIEPALKLIPVFVASFRRFRAVGL